MYRLFYFKMSYTCFDKVECMFLYNSPHKTLLCLTVLNSTVIKTRTGERKMRDRASKSKYKNSVQPMETETI